MKKVGENTVCYYKTGSSLFSLFSQFVSAINSRFFKQVNFGDKGEA